MKIHLSILNDSYIFSFSIIFQRQQLCTVRNAIIVIVTEVFVALGLYSFSIWTISVTYHTDGQAYCTGLQPQYLQLYKIMINIDTLITLVIPSCAIFAFNIRIVFAILKTAKRRRSLREHVPLTRAESSRSSVSNGFKLSGASTHKEDMKCFKGTITRPELKTTRLLIIISTVFIILNCPSHAIRIYESGKRLNDPNFTSSQTMIRVQELAQFFYYLNFSINFFFYTLFTKQFREALQHLCSGLAYRIQRCSEACINFLLACSQQQENSSQQTDV